MNEIYVTTTLSPDITRALLALAFICAALGMLLVEQAPVLRFFSRVSLGARRPKL